MNKLFKYIVITCLFLGVVMSIVNCSRWKDSIYNEKNSPYVVEVAFNLGIDPVQVTQQQFNERYCKH